MKVAERAKTEPEGRFHALAHLIDVPALGRAYDRMRKDAAVGVDRVTKEQYGQDLKRNLQGLHERLVSKRYRHKPICRVHIPKDKGRTRPIGISAFEGMLDLWFEREVKPRLRGEAYLVRYADDLVIGFERQLVQILAVLSLEAVTPDALAPRGR